VSSSECASGRRWGDRSKEEIAGTCVEGIFPDGGGLDGAVDAGTADVACTAEICDGVDNDCDDDIDEDWPTLDQTCSAGVGDCFATGAIVCTEDGTNVECNAVAGTPAPDDECGNGEDDDCDDMIDETCECTGSETQPCGSDVGACVQGVQTCQPDGHFGDCEGDVGPISELCNGDDDDCDTMTDEDFSLGGDCDGADTDLCAEGVTVCSADDARIGAPRTSLPMSRWIRQPTRQRRTSESRSIEAYSQTTLTAVSTSFFTGMRSTSGVPALKPSSSWRQVSVG
jgi:hypothetical protein